MQSHVLYKYKDFMKIYDYNGRKNLCEEQVRDRGVYAVRVMDGR